MTWGTSWWETVAITGWGCTPAKQLVQGYLGENPGQVRQPTGVVVDDMGNLLVGDSGNNRMGVYTSHGKFVKVVELMDWRPSSPHGLVRVDNSVYVVLRGDRGAIVRFTMTENR